MINKLYIKNNIKYNFFVYINIILIITVSIIIVNILNIFVESVIYGSNLYGAEISKGYNIWIKNSDEDDLSYFENIPNTEIKYEDNIIYIKILNTYEEEKIQKTISNIISENNLELSLSRFSGLLNGKSVPYEFKLSFNILKTSFLIIGTISIYLIYLMHIENKKKDLGILISLGMNKKQLKKLLLTELFIIYIFSFVFAVIISNIVMYILIQNYLFTENRSFIMIMYKFSVPSIILLFFVSALSILAAFFMAIRKVLNIPVINTIQRNDVNVDINRNINIWNKSSAVKYIAKANLLRNKKHFFVCSVISVLVVCMVTVLFNLINLLNTPREEPDFSISNNLEENNNSEIIFSNIKKLEKLTGVRDIELISYYNNFLIEKNEAKLSFPIYTVYDENGPVDCHHISITTLTDNQLDEYKKDNENYTDDYIKDNHILLSKNIANSKYKTGDKIHTYDNRINESQQTFTIAGFIDVPQNGQSLCIYVTKENFEKITGQLAIPNVIKIYVDEAADISTIRENINNIFNDKVLFNIIDNIKIRQDGDILYKGILIMVNFLCSVLFICAMILLWAFITFYISNQKLQIDILEVLGAPKKVIRNITIYEAFIKGFINSLAGLIIGTCVSYFVILMSIYNLVINRYLFITYGLIIIITIMAHIVPSFITIKKITAENLKVKENE